MVHGPTYVALMLKYALLFSGYSMPDAPPPKLVELTHTEMIQIGCNGFRPCAVYGFYKDDDIVYVDPLMIKHDGQSEDSVVVHELTHWLQHHHGKGGFHCTEIGVREREAYRVQEQYVTQHEHKEWTLDTPDWGC